MLLPNLRQLISFYTCVLYSVLYGSLRVSFLLNVNNGYESDFTLPNVCKVFLQNLINVNMCSVLHNFVGGIVESHCPYVHPPMLAVHRQNIV